MLARLFYLYQVSGLKPEQKYSKHAWALSELFSLRMELVSIPITGTQPGFFSI